MPAKSVCRSQELCACRNDDRTDISGYIDKVDCVKHQGNVGKPRTGREKQGKRRNTNMCKGMVRRSTSSASHQSFGRQTRDRLDNVLFYAQHQPCWASMKLLSSTTYTLWVCWMPLIRDRLGKMTATTRLDLNHHFGPGMADGRVSL